jgi:hypothetical protein
MGDYSAAIRVLRDEAELQGLYPAKKLEHAGANGGPIKTQQVEEMTDDELANIAAAADQPPKRGR